MTDLYLTIPEFQAPSYHRLHEALHELHCGIIYQYWSTAEAMPETEARRISTIWRENSPIIRFIADHSYVSPLEFCVHKVVGSKKEIVYCIEDAVATMIRHFSVSTSAGCDLTRLLFWIALAWQIKRIDLLEPLWQSFVRDDTHIHNPKESPLRQALEYFLFGVRDDYGTYDPVHSFVDSLKNH